MYPEAGGSSSFARHAFNEFWSFFAAWAQMLNYVDHDRHLGVLRAALPRRRCSGSALRHAPGDIFAGIVVSSCCASSTSSASRSRRASTSCSRSSTSARSCCSCSSGSSSSSRRRRWSTTCTSGVAPTWKRLPRRDPGRDDRLHGDRDDLEHGRGGQGRGRRRSRRRSTASSSPSSRSTRCCRPSRSPRCRCTAAPTATTRRCSALPEAQGGYAGDPVLGVVKHLDLGVAAGRRRDLRRPAGGDDPVHRHERRDHRRLAARLLDGPAPPDARPAAPAAPASTARRGSGSSSSARSPAWRMIPGQADVPGQHVRVRRDAVVHDRAPRGDPAAQTVARPQAPVPRPGQRPRSRGRDLPLFAVIGGIGTGARVRWSSPSLHRRRRGGRHRLAGARDASSTSSTAAARAST